MNPALSVVFFTTLLGMAQGLVTNVALLALLGSQKHHGFTEQALGAALALAVVSLGASFLHLGRPLRAWRAVLMWRTSWLSREVIVLPVFIAVVALWWAWVHQSPHGIGPRWLAGTALALTALLWLCTAKVYASLRFIQEWASGYTLANYVLIGLSSGSVMGCALGVVSGQWNLVPLFIVWALFTTSLALVVRLLSLRRNARLAPKSTLQSATGLRDARVEQRAMGMTAGSFNTREFFHGASLAALRHTRGFFLLAGFILPVLLLGSMMVGADPRWLLLAAPLQVIGLLAERWYFFAQARHPQNLYYQVVS